MNEAKIYPFALDSSLKAIFKRPSWFWQMEKVVAGAPSTASNLPLAVEKCKPVGIVTVFDEENAHCILEPFCITLKPHRWRFGVSSNIKFMILCFVPN